MNRKKWLMNIIGISLALGVGILSALLSRNGMELYAETVTKPALTPPGWVFMIAWIILYTLMGISSVRIWQSKPSAERSNSLNLYVAQLIVNFFWSLIFFNTQAFGFAFVWLLLLWGLVLLMILQFRKVDSLAAKLQIPYILWLTFAAYLNLGAWILNG